MLKLLKKMIKKHTATCATVIVAAGSSTRMQGTDKILYPLDGEPLIVRTVRAFQHHGKIDQIVIVTREELIDTMKSLCTDHGLDKVTHIVPGGTTRMESVMKGLSLIKKESAYVAVHDGARPFVSEKIITDTIEKAVEYHAAAPAIPVKDTIKMATGHIVTHTPQRSSLFAVQTPQIFDVDLLRAALTKAIKDDTAVTDDCSAVEALGMSVYLTEGSDENIKITTPTDLILAQAIGKGIEG